MISGAFHLNITSSLEIHSDSGRQLKHSFLDEGGYILIYTNSTNPFPDAKYLRRQSQPHVPSDDYLACEAYTVGDFAFTDE